MPVAPIVRRETAELEVGTRLKRNVVAFLGRPAEGDLQNASDRRGPYIRTIMRVLLPTERSSFTQKRTPRHTESFGALWHQWIAARKEDDREKRRVGALSLLSPPETGEKTSSRTPNPTLAGSMLISSALRGHRLRKSRRTGLASRFLSKSFLRLWSVDHRQLLPSYQPVTSLRSGLDRSVMQ